MKKSKRKWKIVIIVVSLAVCVLMIQAVVWRQRIITYLRCGTELYGLGHYLTVYRYDHEGKSPSSLAEWMESDEGVYKLITSRNKESGMNDYYIYRGGDLDKNAPDEMITMYEKHANHKISGKSRIGAYLKESLTFSIGIPKKRVVLYAGGSTELLSEDKFIQAIERDNQLRRELGLNEKEIVK